MEKTTSRKHKIFDFWCVIVNLTFHELIVPFRSSFCLGMSTLEGEGERERRHNNTVFEGLL